MSKTEAEYLEAQYKRVKPCPFCGSKKLHIGGISCSAVNCRDCGTEGPYKPTELFDEHQNAFEAWNNRI